MSHPEDKQATPDKTILESPTGLDLHPAPESSPRISKRVGIIIAAAGVLVLGGFAYGGYRRSLKVQADGKSQGSIEVAGSRHRYRHHQEHSGRQRGNFSSRGRAAD